MRSSGLGPWRRLVPGRVRDSLAVVVLVLSTWAGATYAQAQLTLPDNPLRGRLLFESKHCNQCHGLAGVDAGTAPSLGEGRFRGSFLDLGAAMWNHVPGMSLRLEGSELNWPQLDEGEALELATFLYAIEYLGRPGNAAAGRRSFETRGCAACHSIGASASRRGPDLAQLGRFASPLFVAQAIWNHGPTMLVRMHDAQMAPPVFADGDLADISAYIRQTAAAGGRERVLLAPGSPNRGRRVFETRGCISCHAAGRRGESGAPDLARVDLHRPAEAIAGVMWNHALAMNESMQAKGMSWPRLEPGEFADLVAYLYFLPFTQIGGDAQRGATVFRERSCADCHTSVQGRGHPGPDLAGSAAGRSPAALVAAMWNHAPVMREAILGGGLHWPELTGAELRDINAYLAGLKSSH